MTFISTLLLILLTMIAYAGGAVMGASKKRVHPRLVDFLIIILLWFIAFFTWDILDTILLFGIWFGFCYIIGWLMVSFRKKSYPDDVLAVKSDGSLLPQLLMRWSYFAHRLGNYQSRVILMLLYSTVVLPFGLGARLFSDPLNIKSPPLNSAWKKAKIDQPTNEASRRQF